MIRRPPRSTQGVSSAASDVYKRQALAKGDLSNSERVLTQTKDKLEQLIPVSYCNDFALQARQSPTEKSVWSGREQSFLDFCLQPVSYTHLRAHETSLHLVCRLLLEKKKTPNTYNPLTKSANQTI
eukprot:TRINITY_DN71628_c0_g1_i1.p3 TRINITY_DN71628_c0_g1~~TRINITY_DN71628_c0_g1_i1.p3  ORF type:complete len:126 (+),score=21.73 TRINITY_DN71628_c0_g1_i1:123-500(+)